MSGADEIILFKLVEQDDPELCIQWKELRIF